MRFLTSELRILSNQNLLTDAKSVKMLRTFTLSRNINCCTIFLIIISNISNGNSSNCTKENCNLTDWCKFIMKLGLILLKLWFNLMITYAVSNCWNCSLPKMLFHAAVLTFDSVFRVWKILTQVHTGWSFCGFIFSILTILLALEMPLDDILSKVRLMRKCSAESKSSWNWNKF